MNQDFHSFVVKRIWLIQVQNIEFHCFAFSGVLAPEIEPLRVSFRIHVVLKDEVIFMVRDFECQIQVPRFES